MPSQDLLRRKARLGSSGQYDGRASVELGQQAVMAGIPVLAAVPAPSSAAAGLAAGTGLILVGYLRGGSVNVCTGEHRVAAAGGSRGSPGSGTTSR